jgi:hypothetical protein
VVILRYNDNKTTTAEASPTMKNFAPFSLWEAAGNHDLICGQAIAIPPMPTTKQCIKKQHNVLSSDELIVIIFTLAKRCD